MSATGIQFMLAFAGIAAILYTFMNHKTVKEHFGGAGFPMTTRVERVIQQTCQPRNACGQACGPPVTKTFGAEGVPVNSPLRQGHRQRQLLYGPAVSCCKKNICDDVVPTSSNYTMAAQRSMQAAQAQVQPFAIPPAPAADIINDIPVITNKGMVPLSASYPTTTANNAMGSTQCQNGGCAPDPMLPITDMRTIECTIAQQPEHVQQMFMAPEGDCSAPVIYDRLTYTTTTNSRLRSAGDMIRGDLPIQPVLSSTDPNNMVMFRPTGRTEDLQQGAARFIF